MYLLQEVPSRRKSGTRCWRKRGKLLLELEESQENLSQNMFFLAFSVLCWPLNLKVFANKSHVLVLAYKTNDFKTVLCSFLVFELGLSISLVLALTWGIVFVLAMPWI